MNLYLVRHGETDWNKKEIVQGRIDNPLNETGKKQALATGEKLKIMNINFDYIFSSPLIRAKESALIINNILNVKNFSVRENLTERQFGEIEGMKICEMKKIVKTFTEPPKGFETDFEIINRVQNEINEIVKMGENILIVCHSHTIKSLLVSIDPINYNFNYPLKNAEVVNIEYINNQYIIKGIL